MAKQVRNDRALRCSIEYDEENSKWVLDVYAVIEDDPNPHSLASLELDASAGTLQADIDALAAEALVQIKSQEGIV